MFAHYIMNGKQRNAKQFPGTNNTLQIQEKKKHIGYIGWIDYRLCGSQEHELVLNSLSAKKTENTSTE